MREKIGRTAAVVLGVAALAVVVIFVAPRILGRTQAKVAVAAQYLAEPVEHGNFEGTVTGSGTVAPEAEANVEAPAIGAVGSVTARLGQTVKAGAVVATLGGTPVHAPMAGTVVAVDTVSGDYVTAGQTLITIAHLQKLYVDITISETSITQVKKGQSATITVAALTGKSFHGTVTAVGRLGTSSGGTVDYPVTVRIAAPAGILLGMSATAVIDTGTVSNATFIPTSAIETVNGTDEVMIPRSALPTPSFPFGGAPSSGRFRALTRVDRTVPVPVPVTVGISDATDTVIRSGLDGASQVLVANPAATSTTSAFPRAGFGFGGAGLFGGVGGAFPAGG